MLRRLELCVRLTPSAVDCGMAPVIQRVTAGAVGHHLPVQHPGFRHNAGLHGWTLHSLMLQVKT